MIVIHTLIIASAGDGAMYNTSAGSVYIQHIRHRINRAACLEAGGAAHEPVTCPCVSQADLMAVGLM